MKLIFGLILLVVSLPVCGQKTAIENGKLNGILPVDDAGKVTYQAVIPVEGVSKEELFKRARKWYTRTYRSAKDVLQINDPQTGELSGNGYITVTQTMLGVTNESMLRHSISVDVKEGRYRVVMNDFHMEAAKGDAYAIENVPYVGRKFCDKLYSKIDGLVMPLLTSLETAMKTKENDF